MADDIIAALTGDEGSTGQGQAGAVPPTVLGDASAPVDPDAIAEVRERRADEMPKRGRGRPRKASKSEPAPPSAQPTPLPIDPATLEVMKSSLVEAYELGLTLLAAGARVNFTDEERPVVGSSIVSCIETYLPSGFSKHMPLAVLLMVSAQAVVRARASRAPVEPVDG